MRAASRVPACTTVQAIASHAVTDTLYLRRSQLSLKLRACHMLSSSHSQSWKKSTHCNRSATRVLYFIAKLVVLGEAAQVLQTLVGLLRQAQDNVRAFTLLHVTSGALRSVRITGGYPPHYKVSSTRPWHYIATATLFQSEMVLSLALTLSW